MAWTSTKAELEHTLDNLCLAYNHLVKEYEKLQPLSMIKTKPKYKKWTKQKQKTK